jgi:hypothetical protein
MATVDLTAVRPNGDDFAEDRLGPPAELPEDRLSPRGELWAPPLAPFGDEDAFLAPEPSRRMLIASAAIVAALGAALLTYFFLTSGAKAPSATSPIASSPIVSSPTGVESSSKTWVQPSEPSPGASGVVTSPNVPAFPTAAASSQVAASAVTPQRTSTAQNPELVFLQRPSVNIRSAPTGNAPVLGTAPRGTQFTATGREGDWVQVENTRWKGWINSQFLAPDKPQ